MERTIAVVKVDEIPPGTGKEVTVAGRVLAIFNIDGTFYALDGMCLHAGGPLGEGQLSGCIITCPWHGWQYDVTTGQHCLNDALRQPSFPTRVEGDEVIVDLPQDS